MKLISLNVEGNEHKELVYEFIEREKPDCVCLQEAPEDFQQELRRLGFSTYFAPMTIKTQKNQSFTEGLITASRDNATHEVEYYHRSAKDIVPYDPTDRLGTLLHPIILSTIHREDGDYVLANTHLMVTKDGLATDFQSKGLEAMLSFLKTKPSHILCGDFNMPRGFNTLYEKMTTLYTDTIPMEYKSSLDRSLHRHGKRTDLTEPIFESYMVDYIFTQEPYQAHDVRLQFGVSDHAAVVANVTKVETV